MFYWQVSRNARHQYISVGRLLVRQDRKLFQGTGLDPLKNRKRLPFQAASVFGSLSASFEGSGF
jgi:hypothetical protein